MVARYIRFSLLALVLLGTVTNRTFLTWLSSGLDTSLFNFCLVIWVYEALTPRENRGAGWVFRVCLAAMFAALARPDGLIAVLGTGALLAEWILTDRDGLRSLWRQRAARSCGSVGWFRFWSRSFSG